MLARALAAVSAPAEPTAAQRRVGARKRVLLLTVLNSNVMLDDEIGKAWVDITDFEVDSEASIERGVQPALLGRRGWYALGTGGELECTITVSNC